MKKKIKVYFILPTLFAGGAEKVVSFVSQNLDNFKFDAVLVIIGFEEESKYVVDKIPVMYLNKKRVLDAFFSIIKLLFKNRPDIVLCSISHLNVMMGLISVFFPKIKFIARQATINKVASKYRKPNKKTLFKLPNKLYDFGIKKLDCIVCQSLDMKKDFMESYEISETKIKIINNPITQLFDIKKINNNKKDKVKRFITVGRLGKIKGYLRILDILSKLDIPFKYTIIGDGAFKEAIFDKAKELNLTDRIEHIPHTNNVFKYLIKHDMFLQGSYSEGFPNALLESCVVGTPVLAFNVPGGTKEIIENGVNGFLVEDDEDYLNKMKDTREWNPEKIRESVFVKFNKEKILHQYEELFLDILKE